MPILFSPVNQEELTNPYPPRPRTAFLMIQLGAGVSDEEKTILATVRATLRMNNFSAVSAAEVRRTSDFLHKIVDLIRGCGFGVAIFSDRTRAKTLANIFFEIGVAAILGKPVQLIWHGRSQRGNAAPSDFVRTEWIRYVRGEDARLGEEFRQALVQIEQTSDFYRRIGDVAFEARDPDLELAFERYKQSILIANDAQARERMAQLQTRLSAPTRHDRSLQATGLATHRARLLRAVNEFLTLLPAT